VARSRRHGFESCDAEATAVLLVHKALRAAEMEGLAEARLMLIDWLAVVVARAAYAFPTPGALPDASLAACPQLQLLPKLVYGLLCSPLLRALHTHPDARAHAAYLAASAAPDTLLRLLYPSLSSWQDAETPGVAGLPLSRNTLNASSTPLFVLDAVTTVIVYAAPCQPGVLDAEFPPSHKVRTQHSFSMSPFNAWPTIRSRFCHPQSLLRTGIGALRERRGCTPRVLFIRGGVDDSSAFEALLLDDEADGEGGLSSFLAHTSSMAQELLG